MNPNESRNILNTASDKAIMLIPRQIYGYRLQPFFEPDTLTYWGRYVGNTLRGLGLVADSFSYYYSPSNC